MIAGIPFFFFLTHAQIFLCTNLVVKYASSKSQIQKLNFKWQLVAIHENLGRTSFWHEKNMMNDLDSQLGMYVPREDFVAGPLEVHGNNIRNVRNHKIG